MKRLLRVVAHPAGGGLLSALLSAGLIRGYSTLKPHGHDENRRDAPPSLDFLDIKEREAAANEAARHCGAKP